MFMYLPYLALAVLLVWAPVVSAHEVYVLDETLVKHSMESASPNPLLAYTDNKIQFFLWASVAIVVVLTVFFASITHRLESRLRAPLLRLRAWAPLVVRITLGVCLMSSASEHALFGPELPLADFGAYAGVVQLALYLAGAMVVLGLCTRAAAAVALGVFAFSAYWHGWYMLTYTNYVGEILAVLLLGSGRIALDNVVRERAYFTLEKRLARLEPYAFFALRVCFGISVAFAAIYAKFLHSNLALMTVEQYSLTHYFPFDPLFIVLGAFIIELLIGIFFIIGFEIRHTALFFLFWLGLSLAYFGEAVWPHLILFGVNVALFMYGYDKLTAEGWWFKKKRLQPFL